MTGGDPRLALFHAVGKAMADKQKKRSAPTVNPDSTLDDAIARHFTPTKKENDHDH